MRTLNNNTKQQLPRDTAWHVYHSKIHTSTNRCPKKTEKQTLNI